MSPFTQVLPFAVCDMVTLGLEVTRPAEKSVLVPLPPPKTLLSTVPQRMLTSGVGVEVALGVYWVRLEPP